MSGIAEMRLSSCMHREAQTMRDEIGPGAEMTDSENVTYGSDADDAMAGSADDAIAREADDAIAETGADFQPVGGESDRDDQAGESSGAHTTPMRTLLKQFSEQFTVDVGPLIEPIRQVADTLAEASAGLAVQAVLPDLRDLLHHVSVLTEKVAGQQAYVLIFGPLKSGKSTFMNGICSAYVSEVTSLPAYPCIVNVSHDTTPSFAVTRYDGRSETYTAQGSVYRVVQQAHSDLMAAIRQVEDDGEEFDPAIHMPDAIRKIDVHLPTGDLAESGAVLVDTPGLYSRMKFGYDRLTRDFRNAAACAIFIVKTDNLFLEQVFAEFHELLDLFSRVFLIVNLDTNKKDLDPSGQLVPSLEHDDPGRIIDAFTDLSMSTPLKAAADAGRLQIYPVDLLAAASARILGPEANQAERAHGHENFDTLLTDLTDYLNSSEYLRAFLNDSLRRARTLLDDLAHLTQHETVTQLTAEAESLRADREETIAQRQAVQRLKALDWTEQSDALHRFLVTCSQGQAEEVRRITGHALVGAIDTWFENDLSLAALKNNELEPLLNTCRKQFIHFLRSEMAQQMPGMHDAIAVGPDILADAGMVDLDIGALARTATEKATPGALLVPIGSSLTCEQIPVRRRFWDWLLMRSKASVRRHLFGPTANPDKHIPPAAKTKRIGELGREKMQELTAVQFDLLLTIATDNLPEELVASYVQNLTSPLADAIEIRDRQTELTLADIETRLAEAERVLAEIGSLGEHVERTAEVVSALTERFGTEDLQREQESDGETEDDESAGQTDDDETVGETNDREPTDETDEFDDLYAPYVAEAAALPDEAQGDVQDEAATPEEAAPHEDDDDDDSAEAAYEADDTYVPYPAEVDDDDDTTPEAEVVDDDETSDEQADADDEPDGPADEGDAYPPLRRQEDKSDADPDDGLGATGDLDPPYPAYPTDSYPTEDDPVDI